MKIFLASKSPRRRELLKYIFDEFTVGSAEIKECLDSNSNIESQMMSLAFQKANAYAKLLEKDSEIKQGDLIIGADTIVYFNNEILLKPKNEFEAVDMLSKLSGKKHFVYTSIAIIKYQNLQSVVDISKTEVFFKTLSQEDIRKYVDSGECMDKAGAYGIQGKGSLFVDKINGDYYSVMGLPISLLDSKIKEIIS